QRFTLQLARRDIGNLHRGVVVDQADQLLSSVSTGTDQSNLLDITLSSTAGREHATTAHEWRVGFVHGRERTTLPACKGVAGSRSIDGFLGLSIQKLGNHLLNRGYVVEALPEESLAVLGETSLCLVKVPALVGIILVHGP